MHPKDLKILLSLLNDKFYRLIPNNLPNFNLGLLNGRQGYQPLEFHTDSRFHYKDIKSFSYQCFLALGKISSNNGTLNLIPGTHIAGKYPNANSSVVT